MGSESFSLRKMGDVDTAAVLLKYPSGLIAMVDTSRDASYGYDQRIEAFGERGAGKGHGLSLGRFLPITLCQIRCCLPHCACAGGGGNYLFVPSLFTVF